MMNFLSTTPLTSPPAIENYRIVGIFGFSKQQPVRILAVLHRGITYAMELWENTTEEDLKKRLDQLKIMRQLSEKKDSLSVKLFKHIISVDKKSFMIIEEAADINLLHFLDQLDDADDTVEEHLAFLIRSVLKVLVFLDNAGYIHQFEAYDWLLFDSFKTIKFCGHERTVEAERGEYNSVFNAINSIIHPKITPLFKNKNLASRQLIRFLKAIEQLKAPAATFSAFMHDDSFLSDIEQSTLPDGLLTVYTKRLLNQLSACNLEAQSTLGDGYCLLHAITQPLGVSLEQARNELSAFPIPDEQNFFMHLAQMELEENEGGWNSPTILPLVACWAERPIILLMPNRQTGDIITQIFTPNGQPSDAQNLQQAIESTNNTRIVIFHNGDGHFSATTAAQASMERAEQTQITIEKNSSKSGKNRNRAVSSTFCTTTHPTKIAKE